MASRHPLVAELRGSSPQLSAGVAAVATEDRPAALRMLAQRAVPMVHVDVMDEGFAGRIAGSAELVAGLDTSLLKDVHLMVADPAAEVGRYAAAGADAITVHIEAQNPAGALEEIGSHRVGDDGGRPVLRGLALWPETPLTEVMTLIELTDLVLVLGVSLADRRHGLFDFGVERVRELAALEQRPLISYDGGVTPENAAEVAVSGCDLVVSGRGIFGAADPAAALDRMLAAFSLHPPVRGA